jgi:hypothetical protein
VSTTKGPRLAAIEGGRGVAIVYKVVETSDVTDQDLERILNEWTAQGWRWETTLFAMRESSKRPAMAFVHFVRNAPQDA